MPRRTVGEATVAVVVLVDLFQEERIAISS
jgi:hypothetical protein